MEAAEELGKDVGVRQACEALDVPRASLYRRRQASPDPAPRTKPRRPPRALSPQERQQVKDELYSERHRDSSPREVYARLLDEDRYLCSSRTMYRILHEDRAARERRDQLRHPAYAKPELLATGANQVWSWDITKLLGPKKWTYFYLYVILDIYSRYAVGWMLAHREGADLATRLIEESIERQQVSKDQLTLHSDRGPSMTSHDVAQLLASLGVTKSHSRPHVSNDNPFSESQFKTMKYRPQFPKRFEGYDHALGFCREFFAWYNDEHYHTGIGLMTPAMLHYGEADNVQRSRQQVLEAAYAAHPERFVGGCPSAPRPPQAVWINPPAEQPAQEKGPPEPQCPQKPGAPLTHPRPGYPSPSCVPAELDSVSPGDHHDTASPTFEHPSHASENPGGLGAGPQQRNARLTNFDR
jgi:putative transposase